MALRKMESGSDRKFAIEIPLRFQSRIGLIAVTTAPAFVLFLLIPAPLVPPVFSILSFMIACSVAMYALSTKANHHTQGSTIWNIAYAFTLTWIVAGIMSNPKHVFDWFDNLSIVPLFQVVMIDLRRDCRSNSALGRLCSVWRAQLPCLLYLPESPRSS